MDLCPHPPSMRAHSVALTYAHTSARGQMHTHTLKVPTVLGFTSMESPKQVEGLPSIDVTYPQEVHNNCLMNCHETARAQSNTPRARVCTYTHTHTHTYIRMHACMHTCIHAYIHAYIHTYIHTYIHECINTCMHACMHTYIQAQASWVLGCFGTIMQFRYMMHLVWVSLVLLVFLVSCLCNTRV